MSVFRVFKIKHTRGSQPCFGLYRERTGVQCEDRMRCTDTKNNTRTKTNTNATLKLTTGVGAGTTGQTNTQIHK